MFSSGLIASSIFFIGSINAETVTTSVTVTVCGNSVVESGEQCDDGNIISSDGCSSSCQNEGPICGNGVVQSGEQCDDGNGLSGDGCSATCQSESVCGNGVLQSGEQCDDGNTISNDGCSSTCQNEPSSSPVPSGGGGGGGGGAALPPQPATVILKGKAYPLSDITILQDGRVVLNTVADNEANFSAKIPDLTSGIYTFGLWAEDNRGLRSITFSFTTNVLAGTITTIGGIFLPPTISVDKTSIKRGETVVFLGQTAPQSDLSLHINSEVPIVKDFKSDNNGLWSLSFNTSPLEEGEHTGKSKAVSSDGLLSSFGKVVNFFVGKDVPKKKCANGDLNEDGKMNLVDFSIMFFHWNSANDCADQNDDGIVNIVDFSILLYWWTG